MKCPKHKTTMQRLRGVYHCWACERYGLTQSDMDWIDEHLPAYDAERLVRLNAKASDIESARDAK